MAEEEAKPLAYIAETVLKKRKSTEAFALARKAQLESGGKYEHNKKKKKEVHDIKRPEQFVKEFRDQELDLIRMKQRGKRSKSVTVKPKSELLFIVRIQGKNDMHPKTRKILYNLRLRRMFCGVFVKASDILQMLQKVEPYVTYGYPNLKNVKELIYKKGYGNLENQIVPLTDNNIVEQALGKYGIICIEDMVHEIAKVGPHFKEILQKQIESRPCNFLDLVADGSTVVTFLHEFLFNGVGPVVALSSTPVLHCRQWSCAITQQAQRSLPF